jgi:hypothetical protein
VRARWSLPHRPASSPTTVATTPDPASLSIVDAPASALACTLWICLSARQPPVPPHVVLRSDLVVVVVAGQR